MGERDVRVWGRVNELGLVLEEGKSDKTDGEGRFGQEEGG